MPIKNGADYVAAALQSLLAQDFDDFELIISDNASDDRTEEICRAFCNRDDRISYVRQSQDVGMVENFNGVFRVAQGEYFMWAGHHDLWEPAYIRKCVDALEADETAVLCSTYPTWIDRDGRTIDIWRETLEAEGSTPGPRIAACLRRLGYGVTIYGLSRASALRRTRLFTNVYGTDLILLTELASIGKLVKVPESLFRQRVVPKSGNDVISRWLSLSPVNRPDISYPFLSMFRGLADVILRAQIPMAQKLALCVKALYWVNRTFALWIEIEFGFRRVLKRVLPRAAIVFLKQIRGTPRALGLPDSEADQR